MNRAYHHIEDGKTWLRITSDNGLDWDEPISGWILTLDLTDGKSYYTHTDGRKYQSH